MGIPLHPLAVHAAVVFVPLLVLTTILHGLVPRLRGYLWWLVAALGVAAPAAAFVAKMSGDAFYKRLVARNMTSPEVEVKIESHQDLGNLTLYSSIALGVIALGLVWYTRRADSKPAISWALAGLAVVASAVSAYYVFRTGDSGAKTVWDGF